jgi:PAS domain S-box-containing protein
MAEKTVPIRTVITKRANLARGLKQNWDVNLPYRALFEQTGECIFIISLDLHYIAANQQALNLLGYVEHELVNKPVDEVITQDETSHISPDQNSQFQERILKCKNGTSVPVEISTTIVSDDNNEPAYIQSIARDISVRKNTERALKRNAHILSIISEGTVKLLQSTDIETKISDLLESLGSALNVSGSAIFTVDGFSNAPEVQIKYSWANVPCSDFDLAKKIKPFLPLVLEAGNHIYTSSFGQEQFEETSGISFISIPIEGAFVSRGYLCFFDEWNLHWYQPEIDALQTAANLINSALQRDRYEETIRLNEIRNRIIVDSLPDLIVRIDINGKILDYSANPNHPLYIHRDLVYGRTLNQTFPEEIACRIVGKENNNAFVSSIKLDEIRLPYANRIYESNLYPIYQDEALVVIRDVTEEVKLNEMKSDFINRASHELRTPLTSALLMVELIQEGGPPDEMEVCWKTLRGELHRQKDLIDRLLMAGRLESSMMNIQAKVMDLLPVLRESMQSVQPIISKRHISLKMICNKEYIPCPVLGDSGGLQQVFINLLNNAAKFSPEGSQVEIIISQDEEYLKTAIIDKGIGIPEEDLPHLFKRFFRAKNVTVAEIPGSGIGLYIVNSIITELGGKILVESTPNQGTTFTVCLKRVG